MFFPLTIFITGLISSIHDVSDLNCLLTILQSFVRQGDGETRGRLACGEIHFAAFVPV